MLVVIRLTKALVFAVVMESIVAPVVTLSLVLARLGTTSISTTDLRYVSPVSCVLWA